MKKHQKYWRYAIIPALGMALLAIGCVVHEHGYQRVYGPPVHIEVGHVHSAGCGHFYHRHDWYYAPSHVHSPGCGHVFRGGIWIVGP